MIHKALCIALVALVARADEQPKAKPKLWKPSGKKVHDPWKKFCGAVLCYDVLEVDEGASEDLIKKSYRKLAREWHPDKNPEKGAREKFLKIAKAYEVVSTEGERKKYDHLMQHPEEYVKLYGEYYFKVVAPPSDVTFVILLILLIMSGIHYTVLLKKKDEYNSMLIKVCAEGKGPSSGGTVETAAVNKAAIQRFEASKGKSVKSPKSLKADESFVSVVESVLREENLLLLQPTFQDTVGFKALLLPVSLSKSAMFQISWFVRHSVQGEPFNEDEKVYMLERKVEEWTELSEKQQNELISNEAWKDENLTAWRSAHGKKQK